MPKAKESASACIFNNKSVFVFSGWNDNVMNDIEKYNIFDNAWETIKIAYNDELPPKSNVLTFQMNENTILIGGGFSNAYKQRDCYTFDTNKNTLGRAKDLPVANYFKSSSALVHKGELYAFGWVSNLVFKYEVEKDTWEKAAKF